MGVVSFSTGKVNVDTTLDLATEYLSFTAEINYDASECDGAPIVNKGIGEMVLTHGDVSIETRYGELTITRCASSNADAVEISVNCYKRHLSAID